VIEKPAILEGKYLTAATLLFSAWRPRDTPRTPKRLAARHIGKSVQARFAAGIMSFTKAVKITPITSPMTLEIIARSKEKFFIVIASPAAHKEEVI
jgi:hypothetical protein